MAMVTVYAVCVCVCVYLMVNCSAQNLYLVYFYTNTFYLLLYRLSSFLFVERIVCSETLGY